MLLITEPAVPDDPTPIGTRAIYYLMRRGFQDFRLIDGAATMGLHTDLYRLISYDANQSYSVADVRPSRYFVEELATLLFQPHTFST